VPDVPRLRLLGDAALSVEFGDRIDPGIGARVLALDAALAAAPPRGLVEAVPTYRALTLHLDPLTADLDAIAALVRRLCAGAAEVASAPARLWRVPVVYGGAFGEDLEALARAHGMTPEEVVARHAAPRYRVAMIGFMPGFTYLAGLDPALATPRRPDPRPAIPASSVSIGGAQTAIGSLVAPSGWHRIGRTPVRPYHPQREPPFLFAPGDAVEFAPIPASDWPALDAAAAAGETVADLVAP
jgi:KipI family sensor histidine kinase inhibitor